MFKLQKQLTKKTKITNQTPTFKTLQTNKQTKEDYIKLIKESLSARCSK